MIKLKEKKEILEKKLNIKVEQLREVENTRNQLLTDVIETRAQVKILEELTKEENAKK